MEFTKEMIGKLIYAIPTGNNARRGVKEQDVETFKVKGIGKVYITLCRVDSDGNEWASDKYHPETGAIQSARNAGYGGNAGYRFYESLEVIQEERLVKELGKEILTKMTTGWSNNEIRKDLSLDQLTRIMKILDEQ